MSIEKALFAHARRRAALGRLASLLGFASAGLLIGGTTPALAQSGELGGAIFLDDVPGFVGEEEADTVIACRPDGTCITEDGNVLAGFRPAVWPNLRTVDDDPVLETDVQVLATAFGRILLREGTIADTFVSTGGKQVVVTSPEFEAAVEATSVRVPDPLNVSWVGNNFNDSNAFWITYEEEGEPVISPDIGTEMTVSEAFTVPLGTTGNVDGFVLADDTARVVLKEEGDEVGQTVFDFNPTQDDACADGPIGCEDGEQGDLSLGNNSPLNLNALPPGDYSLEFTAMQTGGGPFGLQYAFDVLIDPPTVADFCWTFNGDIPGEKVCVSIAECDDCATPPDQCPADGNAEITLTSGAAGDAICDDLAQQFFDKGATDVLEEFQFVVGLDVPEIANPGSARVATCTIDETEGEIEYVPICRDPASSVVDAIVNNDIPLAAFETPRCVKLGGKTYC